MINNNDKFEYYCSLCHKQVDEEDKFCRNCGAELTGIVYEDDKHQKYYCEMCGFEIPDDYKFCQNCGAKVIRERLCIKCNKSFKTDGDYCPNCGNKI